MLEAAFKKYLNDISQNLKHGDATEHTHRPALKTLLESFAKGIVATNEPTRILCGAPDLNITKGKVPLGHVETKDIGENLTQMERGKPPHGEQFARYRAGLPNWILTDYLEFRWYVNGEHRMTARLADLDGQWNLKPASQGELEATALLDAFLRQKALTIGTARDLAERMAGMTRIIRDLITKTFEHEVEKGFLHTWLVAFREVLIPDLAEKEFADMFAQTLAYGLFAARIHTPPSKEFSREMAAFNLPRTNPFLRKLFSEIAGVDMPETIAWAVDDIVELLKHADMFQILKDFGKGKGKEDPVVHFYETFLAAYDPEMREVRGVFYTPEPVVSYIVRSIDYLLKTRFQRNKGLADESTLILDPATGTATFLYFVVGQIYETFAKQKGAWDSYVGKHLLGRIFGFELLMAPYAIAHLKLGMELQETGYNFGSDQRLGIYLTNTLEEAAKKSEHLIANWISEEASEAAEIKAKRPIMVVLGNPPYSGHSANRSWLGKQVAKGETYIADFGVTQGKVTEIKKKAASDGVVEVPTFIGRLIQDYYISDGVWLDERNPKWLQNDYVKFIRFAQWRIDQTGEGIVGYITSNSYLDSPTFRGMRQCLLQSFNEIYIYDLHGNAKKKERCPDGSEDKNVFDITEGVSVLLCVKLRGEPEAAQVFHADLQGSREAKYDRLFATDVGKTKWKELQPSSPGYLFIPQDSGLKPEYEKGHKITDAMPVNLLGFQTHRDPIAVAFDEETLIRQVTEYLGSSPSQSDWQKYCRPCAYRPFDYRFAYLHKSVTDRPRLDVERHLFEDNLGLNIVRQTKEVSWHHAVVSDRPTPAVYVEIKDGSNLFPLYLYPAASTTEQTGSLLDQERRPNFSPRFLKELATSLKVTPAGTYGLPKGITPEDIFHYTYAVFHSPTFRTRYAGFLKTDFPRLPLTSDIQLFRALAEKGEELTALHVMKSPKLDSFITEFPVKWGNEIEKAQYTDNDQRVWINARQYFGGVPKDVWDFQIGGYQVCERWLKDRKGRTLTYDDIQHYQKIIVALQETIRLTGEIDVAIKKHGDWPII